jgi:putative FmdB family regulatory protein
VVFEGDPSHPSFGGGSVANLALRIKNERDCMPIYEYECAECGRFEVIQKFSDKTLSQCPHCKEKGKKSAVAKAVSASAFHLKGNGWYKTDYSSSGSSKSSTSSTSSTSSDSSGSTESTPKKACGTGCGCH